MVSDWFIYRHVEGVPLNKKFTRPSFLSKSEMHGSLHPQIDLFYCLEKFILVFFITSYAKEENLPATFESEKIV